MKQLSRRSRLPTLSVVLLLLLLLALAGGEPHNAAEEAQPEGFARLDLRQPAFLPGRR